MLQNPKLLLFCMEAQHGFYLLYCMQLDFIYWIINKSGEYIRLELGSSVLIFISPFVTFPGERVFISSHICVCSFKMGTTVSSLNGLLIFMHFVPHVCRSPNQDTALVGKQTPPLTAHTHCVVSRKRKETKHCVNKPQPYRCDILGIFWWSG